ncbi:MAG: SUMF1/EgtB/PvdO family nonheme iron enzyme [Planctomycetota bacterium]|jgi:formylglycine-generating enzyme required for sulfatase activity
MAKADNYALLGDVPVHESQRADLLKFSAYAKVLARATIETRDSITIGVFGEWGTGKTSLMRLIEKEVDSETKAVAVWFNAWQYEREEHLIVPLTATINKQLDEKASKWKGKFAEGAKSIRDALRAIAYGFSIKGKVGIPLISEAEVNLSPKDMIERYQDLTKDSVLARSLYFDAFETLQQCAAGGDNAPRIVVFVDDLDRCFPPKAVELLEGIKLVLNQPGFSFVLGVYERIIQDFIQSKYARDYNIDPAYFEDYLDKIVQVKVPVPAREPDDMVDYITALIDEGRVFPQESTADLVPLIAEACKRNPRSIIRLLNRVMVTVRIGDLEEKQYDPLALLLHIATDEPRYRRFRDALDVTVILLGEDAEPQRTITIGQLLAERLQQADVMHRELIAALNAISVKGLESELKKAVDTLDMNRHLCNLLQSDIGRQWLADTDFRHMLGQASESTLGEKEQTEARQVQAPSDVDDPIRQLQDNMVRIEAGHFDMGSSESIDEQPIHSVELEAFAIGAMPVTQAQYEAIMKTNPSRFKGPDRPVEQVSWHDAMEFCHKLSEKTGRPYTLPTEAQWEYACRAGSTGRYCFGDDKNQLAAYAWFASNSGRRTHPVGRKKPNDWGLYDMHGNVYEWCLDHWHRDYKHAPGDGTACQEPDSDKGSFRVFRGGAWTSRAANCRCSTRDMRAHDYLALKVGFRAVLLLSSVAKGSERSEPLQ